ncbi:MAG: hypothetical protein ACE37N_04580 [Pseudohongiellaceae bacterium]
MYKKLSDSLLSVVFTTLLLISGSSAHAQAERSTDSRWNGQWLAEGTLFQISVTVSNGVMTVGEVESLGFVWDSEAGEVDGNLATIPVSYAGVSGIVQAELVDATTAVAVAASCMPEFMVVCTLARNQQAVFRKVSEPGGEP